MAADVSWVDVLPSLERFVPELKKALGTVAPQAGAAAGRDFSDGFAKAAVSGVEKASDRLAAARNKEADAAGRLSVAEKRLQELRDSGKAKASQLEAAQEALARAQRGVADTMESTERAARGLTQAQERAAAETRQLDAAMDSVDRRSGLLHGAFSRLGGVIAGIGFAAVGRGIFDIGSTFDDITDTIRAGTGATGAALDGLVDSAKNVGKSVPAEFETIGQTITELNRRLGLTGPTLEKLTSQVLEYSRISGEELDLDQLTGAFAAFNITGDQTTTVMDQLFQVSQATGVGVNQLAASVGKGAPVLQEFGFSIDQSALLLGTLDKAGLNSDATLTALRSGLVKFAQDGKEPQEALRGTISELERMLAAGDRAGAIDLAASLFGTRGASQFVAAVESGTVNIEALTSATALSGDTVLGAAEETKDFAERWQEFRNRVLVWLEPVASRVFGALGSAMEWVTEAVGRFAASWQTGDTSGFIERLGAVARSVFDYIKDSVIPTLADFGRWIQRNGDWLLPLTAALGAAFLAFQGWMIVTQVAAAVRALWLVLAANPVGVVIAAVAALAAGLIYAYNHSETFRDIVQAVFRAVADAGLWMWDNVLRPTFDALSAAWRAVATAIGWAWDNVISPAWSAVVAYVRFMWDNVLKPYFGFILDVWTGVANGIKWAWENVIRPGWDALSAYVRFMWDNVLKPYFGFILDLWKAVAEGVKWAWENIIRPAWDAVAGAAEWVRERVTSFFGQLRDGVVGAVTAVRDVAGRIWTGFRDTVVGIAQNVWDWVVDRFTGMRDGVVGIFTGIRDTVVGIWNAMLDLVKEPVRVVIRFINSSIIGNLNKITGVFGLDIPEIPLNFAAGGIVPGGYSPGRDNTIAAVGSGEAIMRPEWTRVVGEGYVNAANRAARQGGVAGVRDFVFGAGAQFKDGGVVRLDRRTGSSDIGGPFDFVGDAIGAVGRGVGSAVDWAGDVLGTIGSTVGNAVSWTGEKIADLVKDGVGFALERIIRPVGGWIADNVHVPFVSDLIGGITGKLADAARDWGDSKQSDAESSDSGRRSGGGSFAGPASAIGTGAVGGGWQSLWNLVKAVIPQARQNSTYRPGDPGFHGRHKAIDFGFGTGPGGAGSAGLASINRLLHDRVGGSLAELIYDGVGDDRPDLYRGRPHTYNAATRAQHQNHVHAAVFHRGGVVPDRGDRDVPAWLTPNERVLTPPQDDYFRRRVEIDERRDQLADRATEVNGFVNRGTVVFRDEEEFYRRMEISKRQTLASLGL